MNPLSIAPSIAEGHSALIRMPKPAFSKAADLVSPMTACLLAHFAVPARYLAISYLPYRRTRGRTFLGSLQGSGSRKFALPRALLKWAPWQRRSVSAGFDQRFDEQLFNKQLWSLRMRSQMIARKPPLDLRYTVFVLRLLWVVAVVPFLAGAVCAFLLRVPCKTCW
jgi:hypothetical protein